MSPTPIERPSPSRAVCTVTFTEEQYAPAEAKALETVGAQLNLKGFRPGKAPLEMIREKANPEAVFEETIRELLRSTLPRLIEEHQLKPIMAPKVEAVSRLPLTLNISFVEYPQVTVKADKLSVEKKEVKADPKDVQRVLDSVIAEQRTMKPVDRASAQGDRVVIDFRAEDESGKELPELRAERYDLIIGEASLLPGFEEELVGLKTGDEKSFSLKLPEKYQSEELRGKPVTFHVKMGTVEEVKTPELTDEFAKEKLNAASASAFKEMVEASILSQEQQFEDMRRERAMMEAIAKNTEVDLAPEIVDEETRMLLQEWSERLERQGMTIQDWLSRENKKPDEIEADMRKQAEERAKLRFGIAKLIEERALTLSEEEVQSSIQAFLADVPPEHRAQATAELVPGTSHYQELTWRATVGKLMKQLIA